MILDGLRENIIGLLFCSLRVWFLYKDQGRWLTARPCAFVLLFLKKVFYIGSNKEKQYKEYVLFWLKVRKSWKKNDINMKKINKRSSEKQTEFGFVLQFFYYE